jgi:hypothetical protein
MIENMLMNEKSVFYLEQNIIDYRNRIDSCYALMQGQDYLKAAGEKYLIKKFIESPEQYDNKLKAAKLTNAFKLAVTQRSTKLTNSPIDMDLEGNPEIELLQAKADVNNNNLQVFIGKLFAKAVSQGCCSVMIDYPVIDVEGSDNASKLDDVGKRPYLRIIDMYTDVLGYTLDENNKLTSIRLLVEEQSAVEGSYSKSTQYYVKEFFIRDTVVMNI